MISNRNNYKQTYIELEVPLSQSAEWMGELKLVMKDGYVPVRWQNGFYHITLAFLNSVPSGLAIRDIMERHLSLSKRPVLEFDKLDSFGKRSGGGVIFLTCSKVPETFIHVVDALRKDLKDAGCEIESDFKLHVTLGRVDRDARVDARRLKDLVDNVVVPSFSLSLKDVNYREYRGRTLFSMELTGDC